MIARGALAWCVVLVAGCGVLLPEGKTPMDRARALEPKCRGESAVEAAAALAPSAINSVEPYYATVPSSSGHDNRMLGARLHVRPRAGVTSESLERTLRCHEAAVVRGDVAPTKDDPYALASRWLQIDVSSEGDGFVVASYPVDFQDGAEVLARARRYSAR